MRRVSSSLAFLVAVNLIPLAGIVFGTWTFGDVLFLYWAESAVIGAYNVVRLVTVGGVKAIFLAPFFTVHFGGFMAGHWVFLATFFLSDSLDGGMSIATALRETAATWWVAIGGLFASHGYSLAKNFFGKREHERLNVEQVMTAPYKRIMVMHVAIIVGACAGLALGTPLITVLIVIAGKTLLDMRAHRQEHAELTST